MWTIFCLVSAWLSGHRAKKNSIYQMHSCHDLVSPVPIFFVLDWFTYWLLVCFSFFCLLVVFLPFGFYFALPLPFHLSLLFLFLFLVFFPSLFLFHFLFFLLFLFLFLFPFLFSSWSLSSSFSSSSSPLPLATMIWFSVSFSCSNFLCSRLFYLLVVVLCFLFLLTGRISSIWFLFCLSSSFSSSSSLLFLVPCPLPLLFLFLFLVFFPSLFLFHFLFFLLFLFLFLFPFLFSSCSLSSSFSSSSSPFLFLFPSSFSLFFLTGKPPATIQMEEIGTRIWLRVFLPFHLASGHFPTPHQMEDRALLGADHFFQNSAHQYSWEKILFVEVSGVRDLICKETSFIKWNPSGCCFIK